MLDMDSGYNEDTPISMLLGDDIYTSEVQRLEGLGEPVTAASIAAATAALATIAGLIKKIGDIFPKGDKKNEEGMDEGSPTEPIQVDDSVTASANTEMVSMLPPGKSLPDKTTGTNTTENFWDKNKTWLKPTAIGVGVLAAALIVSKMMKDKKQGSSSVAGVDGVKKRKKRKGGGGNRKTPIAFM
jgi:hypothetical protein